jgi:hypothetical protein
MPTKPMFEVWRAAHGRAGKGPRFRLLPDALRYVYTQSDGATYAIRTPNGQWHHFEKNGGVTLRRVRSSGIFQRARAVAEDKKAKKGVG